MDKTREKLNEWRLEKVLEYSSKGMTQDSIAEILKIGQTTVSRDLAYIREQAQKQIQNAIQDEIPRQWLKTRASLQAVQRELWSIISKQGINDRDKITALHLIEEVSQAEYSIVTDSTVIDEAMKVLSNAKMQLRMKGEEEQNNDNNNSNITSEEEARPEGE